MVWERIDPRSDACKLCNLMAGRGKMQYSDRAGGSALSVSYELSEAHCDHFHGRGYADMRRYRAYLESDGVTVAHQLMQLSRCTGTRCNRARSRRPCVAAAASRWPIEAQIARLHHPRHPSIVRGPRLPRFDVCAPCYQLHDLQTKAPLRPGLHPRRPLSPHARRAARRRVGGFAHLAQEPTLEERAS